jgi:hypothetical protein
MAVPTPSTPGDGRAGYVALAIGPIELALGQGDVRALESALDVYQSADGEATGFLDVAGQRYGVYAVDDALDLLRAPPAQRRVCVLLEHRSARIGLLADRVESVPAEALRLEPLAPCMRSADSPLEALAVHGSRVLLMTTSEQLCAWLTSPGLAVEGAGACPTTPYAEAVAP